MEASADALDAATERMVAADEVHFAEIDAAAGVRTERDEAGAKDSWGRFYIPIEKAGPRL